MKPLPTSLQGHRVKASDLDSVVRGEVRFAPIKSLWFTGMALAAIVGGAIYFSWGALGVFLLGTGTVLLLGHSLGSHRKLIHNSYQCPKWLEYLLVYMGVQVGLAGPLGLLRQHELRDFAQRLPNCHDYLRHGRSFWRDAWWQLHCELRLAHAPQLAIEPRLAQDRFYRWLENTWMAQQVPPALLLFALGGWGYVFWGSCARVTAGVLGHWLIGWFAHNQGVMHYEVDEAAVQGRNIRFTSLLTMGESWHNNHHAFPGSARLGLFPGEWDPGWWVLMLLRKLGLVCEIRLPPSLPARAELQACDDIGAAGMACGFASVPSLAHQPGSSALLRMWQQGPGGGPVQRLEGPAALLSARTFRWLIDPRIEFKQSAAASRLRLLVGDQVIFGLPALCLAMAGRNVLSRFLALSIAPLAVGFERMRQSFDQPAA